jgi:hypothetical protein
VTLHLHIDRVVLHGAHAAARDRASLQEDLERALTSVMASTGWARAGRPLADVHLDALPPVSLPSGTPGSTPTTPAAVVASAVGGALDGALDGGAAATPAGAPAHRGGRRL